MTAIGLLGVAASAVGVFVVMVGLAALYEHGGFRELAITQGVIAVLWVGFSALWLLWLLGQAL